MKIQIKNTPRTVKAGLAALVLGAVMVFAKTTLQDHDGGFRESLRIEREAPDRSGPLGGYAEVVEKVQPGVVSIYTEKKVRIRQMEPLRPFFSDPLFKRFFGEEFEYFSDPGGRGEERRLVPRDPPRQNGLGSGVVLTEDGYIITNNHVIDGADEIKVRFPDRKQDYDAEVVGRDPSTDVAVLKVKASGLYAATLGDSGELKVGDMVLAIGNPYGLSQTVTSGIVSALGRKNLHIASYENFIQTDASINPGNSGGALVDNRGRVIGINTAIVPRLGGGNLGIGFAIPINLAVEVAERLIEDGEIKRGYLGVMLSDLDEDLADAFGTKPEGALVNEVMPGPPAQQAGMEAGDIVIRYNGEAVRDMAQLRFLVAGTEPGRKVKLVVRRDGAEKTLTVKPGDRAASEIARSDSAAPAGSSEFIDGVRIETIDDELRDRYGIDSSQRGAVVVEVDPDSPAADAGLRVGDLIIEVAHETVASANDAVRVFKDVPDDSKVLLLRVVTREGTRFMAVELKPQR